MNPLPDQKIAAYNAGSAGLLLRSMRALALFALLPALLSGCVLMRGRDFGSWAQPGEKIDLVHFIIPSSSGEKQMVPGACIAMIPIFGDMPQPYLDQLNRNLLNEAKVYFQVNTVDVDRYGRFESYIKPENLMPVDGTFNTSEIARIGQILGVPYVLCARLASYRMHPPQQLVMHFTLVDTSTFTTWLEMKTSYDATEQAVLVLADRYLRARIGRPYNKTNLDILLRSPAQYSSFAAAHAMASMAEAIWYNKQ